MKSINPFKIIIRMPNWLGDFVMATPLIKQIKNKWPKSHLTLMCQGSIGSLVQGNPWHDQCFSFDKPKGCWLWSRKKDIIEHLRSQQYDLSILTTLSWSSAWYFWKSGIKNRLGYANYPRSLLINQGVKLPKDIESRHLVEVFQKLIGLNSFIAPKLYVTEQEKQWSLKFLESLNLDVSKHCIIGIHPCAAYGPAKQWPTDYFIRLSQMILTQIPQARLLFLGDKKGQKLIQSITQILPQELCFDLSAQTNLRQLMSILCRLQAFVTNDSGPMHLADALSIPLVALFGSTNPIKTGPYRMGGVLYKRVSCSPCYKRECPIDFKCMYQISPAEVYQNLCDLLKSCRQSK